MRSVGTRCLGSIGGILSTSPPQTLQPFIQYRARPSRLHAKATRYIAYLAAVVEPQGYGFSLTARQLFYCRSYVYLLNLPFPARAVWPSVILKKGGKMAEQVWPERKTGAGVMGVEQLAVLFVSGMLFNRRDLG